MLKKCSLSNFASTCTFYFYLKTQTCVSRRKRSQMLNQLRWIGAPRVPLHLDRGMHRHIKGCVGSWIFARPITSPFPRGCIAGTDSAQQEAVWKRFSLCVCVCVFCVYVGVYAHMCVMTEKLFFIMGWRSFTRKTGLRVWIILHHLIHKRLHLVMLPIVT